MTIFKKVKQISQQVYSVREQEILSQLRDLPFWIWDKTEHESQWNKTNGKCCWNHSIPASCPRKDNVSHPIYSWQKPICDALLNEDDDKIPFYQKNHLSLLASRGCGKSEIALRLMMYCATKDRKLSGSQMALVSGNSTLLSIALVERCKKLFWNESTNVVRPSIQKNPLWKSMASD
jgi:hypothetical protein